MATAVEIDRDDRIRLPGGRQGRQPGRMCSTIRLRSKASRPGGRRGGRRRAAAFCRCAMTRSRCSRSRRCSNTGTTTAIMRRRAPAFRCCNLRSPASGTGTRGRFPNLPAAQRRMGARGTGRSANGWAGAARRRRRRKSPPRHRPGPIRPSRSFRRSAGRPISRRASPPTRSTSSPAARPDDRAMPPRSMISN